MSEIEPPEWPKYSDVYSDDVYDYRHVVFHEDWPRNIYKKPLKTLMTEPEWRALGIQQSRGWVHYHIYKLEPHIFLFRRPKKI